MSMRRRSQCDLFPRVEALEQRDDVLIPGVEDVTNGFWLGIHKVLFDPLNHLRDLSGLDKRRALMVLDNLKGASLRHG